MKGSPGDGGADNNQDEAKVAKLNMYFFVLNNFGLTRLQTLLVFLDDGHTLEDISAQKTSGMEDARHRPSLPNQSSSRT